MAKDPKVHSKSTHKVIPHIIAREFLNSATVVYVYLPVLEDRTEQGVIWDVIYEYVITYMVVS